MNSTFEITNADWSKADTPEYHERFEQALSRFESRGPEFFPLQVGSRTIDDRPVDADTSPADPERVVGRVAQATPKDVDEAVRVAHEAFNVWRAVPWRERIEVIRRAAAIVDRDRFDLAVLLSVEVGKNRLEAMSEVEEVVQLFYAYTADMERADGFNRPFPPLEDETTTSLLLPYGVWGVISPFNFPLALSIAPAAAALMTGNTALIKPSPDAPLPAFYARRLLIEAGVPEAAVTVLPGGPEVGKALVKHDVVGGLTFTGSAQVGTEIYHSFSAKRPRPCLVEMGGKNPAIVLASADLDMAAAGIARSAFRFAAQKCSACSRVLVEGEVREELVRRLIAEAEAFTVGNPLDQETVVGPVINQRSVERYQSLLAAAGEDGDVTLVGRMLVDPEAAPGNYAQPAIVTELPSDHPIANEELFVPILAVQDVASLDDALAQANSVPYGLTAGFYGDEQAAREFLDRIEAGLVYVNRRAGATTGTTVKHHSFGGWKVSGSTGKNAHGPYYLEQYMREQCRPVL